MSAAGGSVALGTAVGEQMLGEFALTWQRSVLSLDRRRRRRMFNQFAMVLTGRTVTHENRAGAAR